VAIAAPGTLVKALSEVHTEEKDTVDQGASVESTKPPKESNGQPCGEKDGATEVSQKGDTSQVSKSTDGGKSKQTDVLAGSNQPEQWKRPQIFLPQSHHLQHKLRLMVQMWKRKL